MPNWTREQSDAITTRNRNLLVSAGAGSGKTAVLVERIIQLVLDDKVDIDKLLIVTFTNAAAGEMRERILQALLKKMEAQTCDIQFLSEQITKLNRSYIMTFHSFCMTVVRDNFQLIGVDPGFNIGDTNDLNILINESLDDMLEKEYEFGEPVFHKLVESYSENRSDRKLAELILEIYRFIQSAPVPEVWLEEAIEKLVNHGWEDKLVEYLLIDLTMCKEILEDGLDICTSIDGPIEYEENIHQDLYNVEKLLDELSHDIYRFEAYAQNVTHSRLKSIRGKRKEEIDLDKMEEVKSLRKNYKKILDGALGIIKDKSLATYNEELENIKDILSYLKDLVNDFTVRYSEKKLQKNILDFNDLEHLALKILDHSQISAYYQDKFAHIFVDEYQDSNLVQETLVSKIKGEDNLFLVGDVKQSIYKFRLADSSIFLNKYKRFSKDKVSVDQKIDLNKNFRSRKEILDFTNTIFENLMSEKFGEIEYNKDLYLYNGTEFQALNEPPIELNILYKEKDGYNKNSTVECEALYAAKRIKELIGTPTFNAKAGKFKEIEYRDIVILLRAVSSSSEVYGEIFANEGIPLYLDNQTGYFDSIEIKIMLDLLKIIDNKQQDIPLMTVMRSPLFKFAIDDLIEVRSEFMALTFLDGLKVYIKKDNELSQRIRVFLDKITLWKDQSKWMQLDELIWGIIEETNYFDYVGAMPGGKQRQGNLRLLVERAANNSNDRMFSLYDFIKVLEKMKRVSGDFSTAKLIGEHDDVVRLMSIHKSKGLEFPVVIVGGLGKKFNLRDTYKDIIMHKELGFGPKYVNYNDRVYTETLPRVLIKRSMKLESLSEEMRILYVAFTRAVDRLILIGTENNIEKKIETWKKGSKLYNIMSLQSYLGWVASILSDQGFYQNFSDFSASNNPTFQNDATQIKFISIEEIGRSELEKIDKKMQMKQLLEDIRMTREKQSYDSVNVEHNQFDDNRLPAKISVSEIKKIGFDELSGFKAPELVERPKFLIEEGKLTGAELGIIVHKFMQTCQLDGLNTNDGIAKELKDLESRGIFNEKEITNIKLDKVELFFSTVLGKRMLTANQVFREKSFVLKREIESQDNNMLIQGIIDCYFIEDDGIVLIDYKTDYIEPNGENDFLDQYRGQIDVYKEAIEKITGMRVFESYLYSFSRNRAFLI